METYRDEILDAIPELVPGTDALQHENDVMFVALTAMEEFGARSISEFMDFFNRQEALMKMSHEYDEGSRYTQPPPMIQQVAKYLRARKLTLSTSRMIP